ncbi:class I SAM-dependent methyltransferase [Nonomuraea mesophila]|uniref:Class I SAM-dependent methyltransferase n=1 Tax=Nonomuraea mesophila TaxID=2530382 RepID=A0A4R5FH29_9ACTN|nr:class I SAM-dependent methyltransferase [Nonomuraea mesophila]TDE49963.1 class I SAM-dependent methyltransferase [Nonomuraea mesophila]
MDWQAWHDEYDDPGSRLAQRLRVVQQRIRLALDACPAGPLRLVSLCAGQGRDVLEALDGHPRRGDVLARLVELDPGNSARAEETAGAAGLEQVEVVTADAALTDHYQGMVPADIVVACGVFGNITDEDVERTIATFAQLCRSGGTVIWTRHRRPPDLVPQICRWFEDRGYHREWLSEPGAHYGGVGVHRFTGSPQPLAAGRRMFTFARHDEGQAPVG